MCHDHTFQARTGVSPSQLLSSMRLGQERWPTMLLQTTIRYLWVQIHTVSSSRFSRPYWGNHSYFLFLRLIICLNSARSLTKLRFDSRTRRKSRAGKQTLLSFTPTTQRNMLCSETPTKSDHIRGWIYHLSVSYNTGHTHESDAKCQKHDNSLQTSRIIQSTQPKLNSLMYYSTTLCRSILRHTLLILS